jgi:hypothetical protein
MSEEDLTIVSRPLVGLEEDLERSNRALMDLKRSAGG